jgi:hypothetical protein
VAAARKRLAAFKGSASEVSLLKTAVDTVARAAAEPQDTPLSRARALNGKAQFLSTCIRTTWNEEEAERLLCVVQSCADEVGKLAAAVPAAPAAALAAATAATAAAATTAPLGALFHQIRSTLEISIWSVRSMKASLAEVKRL